MTQPRFSRRQVLGGLVSAPLMAALYGCSSDDSPDRATSSTSGADTTENPTTSTASTEPTTTDAAIGDGQWASGTTQLITVDYPDTSIFTSAATCVLSLTPGLMEGPCYFQTDTVDDISAGKAGLPMQLCLQLVDGQCEPLKDYTLEVWHCDTRGIYSGDTSASADAARFAGAFCTEDDAEAQSSTYMRGQGTTDADGRVNFKTLFPGWYRGRTIHIHFAVTDPQGTTRIISQWCYPDELADQICTTHDQYSDRGVQDTPLAQDTVFPPDSSPFVLSTRANTDGTMLSYGVIQIDPTAVAADTSSTGGMPGGGGPGGGMPQAPGGV